METGHRLGMASALALLLAGCADPDGAFEAFAERYRQTHDAGGAGGTGGDGGVCPLPAAAEVTGRFLFVISPSFSPKTPILFLDDVNATADGADHIQLGMTLTALSAADRTTPVGAPFSTLSASLGSGAFSFDLGVLQIVGQADPIIPGAPITGSVVLDGELCGGAIDFLCGAARGHVTAPAELDLAGSTWTLSRTEANGDLPEIAINCARDAPGAL